jgi:hypothetical protein
MSDTKVIIDISNNYQIYSNREMDVYVINYDPNDAQNELKDETFQEFIPFPPEDKDNFDDFGTIRKVDVTVDAEYSQQVHEYHKNMDYVLYSQTLRQYYQELISDVEVEDDDE